MDRFNTFRISIEAFYRAHKRDLPWRKEVPVPYEVWLSEIILQQTRVSQGLPYYINFVTAFPTVKDLANADEQKVLKLWQGLGYYSRARNLHFTAKFVVENHHGIFPNTYIELLKLNSVDMRRFENDTTITVESYKIKSYETIKTPFEGHYMHYNTMVQTKTEDNRLNFSSHAL